MILPRVHRVAPSRISGIYLFIFLADGTEHAVLVDTEKSLKFAAILVDNTNTHTQ